MGLCLSIVTAKVQRRSWLRGLAWLARGPATVGASVSVRYSGDDWNPQSCSAREDGSQVIDRSSLHVHQRSPIRQPYLASPISSGPLTCQPALRSATVRFCTRDALAARILLGPNHSRLRQERQTHLQAIPEVDEHHIHLYIFLSDARPITLWPIFLGYKRIVGFVDIEPYDCVIPLAAARCILRNLSHTHSFGSWIRCFGSLLPGTLSSDEQHVVCLFWRSLRAAA